jgi:hypothetical protein
MNLVEEDDDASISEDDGEVIGIRSSRLRTNWRFRYDALNQQDVALLAHLQVQSDGIFTQIHMVFYLLLPSLQQC